MASECAKIPRTQLGGGGGRNTQGAFSHRVWGFWGVFACFPSARGLVFRYNSAKKDNDFIYHEAVPALDTLQSVKGEAEGC